MKTQLDLLTSAEATARLMMNAPNAFAAEQQKLQNFEATGQDPSDWQLWNSQTNQRLAEYAQLSKQDAPSSVLAKQKAATEAAALKAAQQAAAAAQQAEQQAQAAAAQAATMKS
jgi:hypothetical protein